MAYLYHICILYYIHTYIYILYNIIYIYICNMLKLLGYVSCAWVTTVFDHVGRFIVHPLELAVLRCLVLCSSSSANKPPSFTVGCPRELNVHGIFLHVPLKDKHKLLAHVSLTAEPRVLEENKNLHRTEPQFLSLVCTRVSANMPTLQSNVTSLKASRHHHRRKKWFPLIDTNTLAMLMLDDSAQS